MAPLTTGVGIGGASGEILSSRPLAFPPGAVFIRLTPIDALRFLIDRDGLNELELPMLYRGCIAAVTDGLGLWECIDGSEGLRAILSCAFGVDSS